MMRRRDDSPEDIYEEAGTLVLWRWLGFDRFFPPNMPYQKTLRGCASVSFL
jgi:polycomb protein EED